MSKSTSASHQLSSGRAIPTRNVILTDPSQLPHDYGTTPGGTLFSTTPGGTRIIYERSFLIQCRNSPLAKSPPAGLPKIPGVTSPEAGGDASKENGRPTGTIPENGEEPQFEMDI